MEVVIITGLSGAGKTKAADWFEDKGYYCIDNMPPALIKNFIDLSLTGAKSIKKAAFVIDVRGGSFFGDLKASIAGLERDENVDFKILFIEASNETLIRRYNESRRIHPLSTAAITSEVIEEERKKLAELRAHATYIIDTSTLKVAELNSELDRLFARGEAGDSFILNFMSFGYKHGIPVCGMVKDDDHRTRGLYYNNEEIIFAPNSEAFLLVTRIQDEAHRFAIEYHRSLRAKGQVHSVLDDIKGVGPKRRKELMKYFKDLGQIKTATVTELLNVPGMNQSTAEAVYEFFHVSKQ